MEAKGCEGIWVTVAAVIFTSIWVMLAWRCSDPRPTLTRLPDATRPPPPAEVAVATFPAMSSLPALPESEDSFAIFGARRRVGNADEGVRPAAGRGGRGVMNEEKKQR